MRARGAAQATVRVHRCDGGQGTSLKHGLTHPTIARAPAHPPTSPSPVRLTTRNIQAVCGATCTSGSETGCVAGKARPATRHCRRTLSGPSSMTYEPHMFRWMLTEDSTVLLAQVLSAARLGGSIYDKISAAPLSHPTAALRTVGPQITPRAVVYKRFSRLRKKVAGWG
jgi:hypothetical protein